MADISKMNIVELDTFLKRDDITKEQRAEAMIRMNEISRRDETRPGSVPIPKPKPKPKGQQVAKGGKVRGYAYGTPKGGVKKMSSCRGRKAMGNKD
jgi:hypothetical protein